jgi:hypothetical protein
MPERLARGKYLVEGILQCDGCHAEVDYTKRPEQVVPGKKGEEGRRLCFSLMSS